MGEQVHAEAAFPAARTRVGPNPSTASAGGLTAVLALQRRAGNRATTLAVQRLAVGQSLQVQRQQLQEVTLDQEKGRAGQLPEQDLEGMDPGKVQEEWSEKERLSWYGKALGRFEAQLQESSARHGVPEQVVAVVVLNEMADIDWKDVLEMHQTAMKKISLGMGQIETMTAIKDKLLPTTVPAEAARLLRIPQWNIEASAAEVAHLIELMGANLDKPWQQHFGYGGGPPAALVSQCRLGGHTALAGAAAMVVGAYNSPNICTTTQATLDRLAPDEKDPFRKFLKVFPNGFIHASNSIKIADDVAGANMFVPRPGRPAPRPTSDLAGYDK